MLPKELVEEAAGGVKGKEGTADPGVVDGDVHGGQMSVGSVAWSTPSAAAPTSLLYMQFLFISNVLGVHKVCNTTPDGKM